MFLIVFCVLISALAVECTQPNNARDCAQEKCELVGNTEICTQCQTGKVPIDGVCVEANTAGGKCEKAAGGAVNGEDTVCGKCLSTYFMYKGGCYLAGAAASGTIGSKMCKEAAEGICTKAADIKNYFVPPTDTDATHDSVVWCGDVTGVTLSGKTYKGVDGCAVCNPPASANPSSAKAATCSACKGSKIVKTVDGVTSCVEEADCNNGYFVNTNSGKKCTACTDENCDVCGAPGAGKCSKCKTSGEKVYLKKENADSTGVCVNAGDCTTGNTHFTDDAIDSTNGKMCKLCKDGGLTNCPKCEKSADEVVCKECTAKFGLGKKSCVQNCPENSEANRENVCTCTEGFEPNDSWSACQPKSNCRTPGCKTCDNEGGENEVCTACLEGKYLTPTNQCVPDCTVIEGYYNDRTTNRCEKCSSNCKTCLATDKDKCTSCPVGKALTYANGEDPTKGGTCGDACKVTEGGAGCKVCGARIGETDYCSQCSETQVPIDGVCVQNTGNRAALCTAKGDGTCASCAGGDLLKDGGCYKTDRLPGKSICTTASNSKCTKCANGLNADGDGACGDCHPTCATCSTAGAVDKCKTCATGYYKTSNSDGPCKKCSEGLAGCRQCTASSTSAFMCLEMGDDTGDNTGGSVNKSGLSTGAIAGISVAVVVVVGGLVGFLCWWFICRGKA